MSLKSDTVLYTCVNFKQLIDVVNAAAYFHLALTLQTVQGRAVKSLQPPLLGLAG